MIANEKDALQRMKRFVLGELTWAEVEGFTSEQARDIAEQACALARVARLGEAQILLEGLAAVNPKDAGVQAALGTVYEQLGRPQDAHRAYDAALENDATHAVALANRGELRLRAGDAGGYSDLVAAIAADPSGETQAGKRAQAIARALALAAKDAAPESLPVSERGV